MAAVDSRSHKVTKRGRDRKLSKTLDKELISRAIDGDQESLSDTEAKRSEKKSRGIVIDGKTYTCATCKAGHRVGVCKHGRERPMKATHPPGRPPAGAPKKIVCDCPKTCSCVKKDCKCARKCNCIQAMYMLVYIPAPDEDEDPEDEKGSWKLGEQVMTDLKGNVLTPEQVKERQEKKDAMKSLLGFEMKPQNGLNKTSEHILSGSSQPEPKDCCKHKENVSNRNIAAQASPVSGIVPKSSAEGCNCGHACNCAFCPQHPNNSTSMNVARQQAMHFANHPNMENHSIVPFLPSIPQNVSCMGGQPRFAMSKHAGRPNFKQLQTIFPNPGYVIGYPVWPLRNDHSALDMTVFQADEEPSYSDSMPVASSATAPLQFPVLPMGSTHHPAALSFPQDDYGIGDAFVASAGIEGWNNDAFTSESWNFEDTTATTPFSQNSGPEAGTNQLSELQSTISPMTTPFQPFPDLDISHFVQPSEGLQDPVIRGTSSTQHTKPYHADSCCRPVEIIGPMTGTDMSHSGVYPPSLTMTTQHHFDGLG